MDLLPWMNEPYRNQSLHKMNSTNFFNLLTGETL